ncbi:predicted protein [Naegleria gruberi]|uniref:Predicted protein n=1 Tax=Naegleria gruberi TaxID=5762 RepID=D2V962_NAEGR|nr:uncharacterized protein NAEGRDRAFT_65577 [Naegleria gruberi]EFC46534.1 predicted protein [Naegleria gruberi]|eukprot:XP_002679278.1 predicted protein [Naegleria gruberi strain NEG-M]
MFRQGKVGPFALKLKSSSSRRFYSNQFDKNDEITYSLYEQGIKIKHWTCLPANRSIPFAEIKEIVIPNYSARSNNSYLCAIAKYDREIYEVRTRLNEIYSLSPRTCLELPQFSKWYKIFTERQIPIYDQGSDCIWKDINKPFLFDKKVTISENIELLHEHYKIPKQELKELYEKIENPMNEYVKLNIEKFCTPLYSDLYIKKEWIELGFSDTLAAMQSSEFNQFAIEFTLKYEDRSNWKIVNGVNVL